MRTDWVSLVGNAVATALVIVLLIATFARGAIAPGAMILVASLGAAFALSLFAMVSFSGIWRQVRGDDALRALTRLSDDQWGVAALRFVVWAQALVVAFVFGIESAEFTAAFSAFAISTLLAMRRLGDVGSSQ